jgi:hypothetical protein
MQYVVSVCVSDDEAENLTSRHVADILQEYITQTPDTEISACIVEAEQVRDAEISQKI